MCWEFGCIIYIQSYYINSFNLHAHPTPRQPNETQRLEILKIHAQSITKRGDIDFESVVKLADGMNGADLRNVCTEAGLFAIRADRDYVLEEDFMKAARKLLDNKKLESKLDYSKV